MRLFVLQKNEKTVFQISCSFMKKTFYLIRPHPFSEDLNELFIVTNFEVRRRIMGAMYSTLLHFWKQFALPYFKIGYYFVCVLYDEIICVKKKYFCYWTSTTTVQSCWPYLWAANIPFIGNHKYCLTSCFSETSYYVLENHPILL